MNVLKEIIDVDKYHSELSDIIINDNEGSLVFIDTNILIWIYRLNSESFKEITFLFNDLSAKSKLIIPIWVVHEYNNLLNNNSELVFFPFKKRLKSLEVDIMHLEEIGRLLADNEFCKKLGFINKREFIKEIKNESDSLIKKIHLLNEKNNFKTEKRREYIEKLIENTNSKIRIDQIISESTNFDFRFKHQIPPGFEDEAKSNNKYGDIIIWKDILLNCIQKSIKKCLFLSLDLKKDWVFSPQKLILNKKLINNNVEPKFHFIHPWLDQEFSDATGGTIIFSDIKLLTDVLYSPDYNMMEFEKFKSLAKTVNIELKNNETNQIIEWLIVHGEKLELLKSTVCKWENDPGEVDMDELRQWGIKNITLDIDFRKVDWTNIFLQLFL